jgi:hypothetical protein
MKKDTDTINLLQNSEPDFLTQFLNWTLTIGRLLIILTETIALATFIYRFSLDMQIVDLHDAIKNRSYIVQNFQKSETAFRSLQQRLSLIKKYDDQSSKIPTIFHDITEMGRGNLTFQNIIVSTDTVKIVAQASSSNALSLFVAALKNYPAITSISIDKIENRTSNATITIGITAYLQK